MDVFKFYDLLNSISVIFGRLTGNKEWLRAMIATEKIAAPVTRSLDH